MDNLSEQETIDLVNNACRAARYRFALMGVDFWGKLVDELKKETPVNDRKLGFAQSELETYRQGLIDYGDGGVSSPTS